MARHFHRIMEVSIFFSEEGAAVVANDGTLLTVIPKSKYDDAYKALSKSLFGR